ncbi:MAG: hypothetical protein JWP69_2195 [Flaviaesturariibacter sp.]|nr:hypothetical protein [Flaviaesturariibacter sp.]
MNHFISLSEASTMTALYRSEREAILNPAYQGQNVLPLSETFDRAAFDTVLAQEGCTALRIYYGMDEDSKVHGIIVGVNALNEDMVTVPSSLSAETEEEIIERGTRCPDICAEPSPLNGG